MTIHKNSCMGAQADWQVAAARYDAEWPHRCETCEGWGGQFYQYDPSPPGVSLSPGFMTDYDPCPDCVEAGFCPRCGHNMPEDWQMDEDDDCPICEWKYDTEGRPEQPDCYCWEAQVEI